MSWVAAAGRILLASFIALLCGWLYGYPLQALLALFVGLVVVWLYQMRKVQFWLLNPAEPPPDAYGIWGELLARIYFHQRSSAEIELQLREHVNYLQDSFSSMRDGVVMIDREGAIKWLNRAAEPLLGLRYPQDTGHKLANLVRAPEFNEYFLGDDFSEPLQYVSGDDRRQHLRVEVTRFGAGERLLFVRDISEAVRLEQIRRDFVANVSHELRTPLTVISGYLDTFLATTAELPEKFNKPLRQMSQQADRMESLLKDLLWLSRIENDTREEQHEPVDITGLLQEVREEFSDMHPDTPIELDVRTDRKVCGNYRQLYSAVSNLLSNAVKYSEPGSPVVIHWYSSANECIVEVEDYGVGIDPVHIPRLTERFYRVDDSRSSMTGGTGLGLAIVKHVVAAHGGDFRITSEPSVGSTFALIFPIGDTDVG
ncbi:MAG: phosphate regulon sensor histidine kinase PhoR [Halioglobus sp.]